MDFIVPMVYWDIQDPLPNFDDLWMDFKNRTDNYKKIYPGILLKKGWMEKGEIARQIEFVRKNGGEGTVMFAIGAQKDHKLEIVKNIIYPNSVSLPDNMKRTRPEQIFSLDVSNLLSKNKAGQDIFINDQKVKKTDSKGKIGFLYDMSDDSLFLATEYDSVKLLTRFWQIPQEYTINCDSSFTKNSPWVEMRSYPSRKTSQTAYEFLFKTDPASRAWINQDTAHVYQTGVFFDTVALEEGKNRVRAKIVDQDSKIAFYEREFVYEPEKLRQPYPLWVNEQTIQPGADVALDPEDQIRIQFQGSKGQNGYIKLNPGDIKLNCQREDFSDFSIYKVDLPFEKLKKGRKYELQVGLNSPEKNIDKIFPTDVQFSKKPKYKFPLVKTVKENSLLEYSMARIRLGLPIIAEYPPGVILQTKGKIGDYYKVELGKNTEGIIEEEFVKKLPSETVKPFYYIRSMLCDTTDSSDVLHIPYPEPVPYAIYPQPDQNRIVIALYGVKSSSTWLTHRTGRKYIEKVTWEQSSPEVYKIYVNLKSSRIWGYDLKRKGNMLEFSIKHAPKINHDSKQPLKGLKIALEAGHGGESYGAIGLSGIQEKELNLDLAHKLADTLRSKGAKILQVRKSDTTMWLSDKRDTVRDSDADLFLSIHANAGGGGYLRVEGTSTYYNNPFWSNFADNVYKRLLELDLDEFGMVGSFNYKVIRITEMPSILVEQAFLSHAVDEEKLASQKFRCKMAHKIYKGILDYLKEGDK